jgi:hypothetical protein
MRKIALGIAVASAILAGCAKKQPNEYVYTAPDQKGLIWAHEEAAPGNYKCPTNWRDGQPFVPNGVRKWVSYNLSLSIKATVMGERTEDLSVTIPSSVDEKVLIKDNLKAKSYFLGVGENGMVKQGDTFFYNQGLLLRATTPNIQGDDYQVCLGFDHFYVPEADLNSSQDPIILLDRFLIPFSGKPGEEQTFTFGTKLPTTLVIKAEIK